VSLRLEVSARMLGLDGITPFVESTRYIVVVHIEREGEPVQHELVEAGATLLELIGEVRADVHVQIAAASSAVDGK
jgi:hypothetical protein